MFDRVAQAFLGDAEQAERDLARNRGRHALVGEVDRDLMLRRQLAPQAVDGRYQTDQLEFWRM